nr:hypothetical protein [uncultured Azospirillum sp.]
MTSHTNAPPHYIAGTCTVCGAKTYTQAEKLCQVTRDCTDEYECLGGAVDDCLAPADGRLYFPNPAFTAWEDARIDALMRKDGRS